MISPEQTSLAALGNTAADLAVLKGGGKLQRVREKAVAKQNGNRVSPLRVHRRLPAPLVGPIQDVIVNERRRMNEFNDHSEIKVTWTDVSSGAACEQREGGTKALSVAFDGIRHISLNRRVERSRLRADPFLDGVQLRINQLKGFLDALD